MDVGAPPPDWEEAVGEYEPPEVPAWRRRVLVGVAALVAASMMAVPVWNLIDRPEPPLADSGLEICGFDYCEVQEAMLASGLDLTMSRLSGTLLTPDEAQRFADVLVGRLGGPPLTVEMVDRLPGRAAGRYDSIDRRIMLERPLRAWIVLHEVAHSREGGHGPEFQAVVVDLATWVEELDLP